MLIISRSNSITCFLGSKSKTTSKFDSYKLEVFYSKTKDLSARYSDLKNYITNDEQLRANKFHFNEDKETYISCHALLRLILAKRLYSNPLEISFKNKINNKPGLPGNPIYFNITHTREAFAIAISRDFHMGIDLERINQSIDIHAIIVTYFSKKECEYILKSETGKRNRFFLLWTRKEALLKALGTGVINNLSKIEVSERENYIDMKSFDNLVSDAAFSELFIYSKKLWNYYLSIAVPCKTIINFYHLNKENIVSYLD